MDRCVNYWEYRLGPDKAWSRVNDDLVPGGGYFWKALLMWTLVVRGGFLVCSCISRVLVVHQIMSGDFAATTDSIHGRRWVGDGGDASPPTFRLGGDHIGNVPPFFA